MDFPPNPTILPPPFTWLYIPAGQVKIEGTYVDVPTTFNIPSFYIAKYPITVAQFAVYDSRYFEKSKSEHPVTKVDWVDAVKFCRWLTAQIGLEVSLPTDQQWQRAALGDTDWVYPWGNEFALDRCNTEASGIGSTTPVIHYPEGVSPYGVMDMSGNVWEWCQTSGTTGKNTMDITRRSYCVVKGGSWSYPQIYARATHCYNVNPHSGDANTGFRLVVNSWIDKSGYR